jgi:tetratricopeptide (TPR) repeat protein
LTLVNLQEDVPGNWTELGRLQEAMGAYGDARYAFTRAYELNRSDPEIVRALTRLSLRGGDFVGAQTYARELELIAPGDSWIKLTDGYAALNQSRFDEAINASDALLAASPFDPNAKVLKARALVAQSRIDEALVLLKAQLAAQPNDVGALQLIQKVHEQRKDWPRAAESALQLTRLMPENQEMVLILITALFRSGAAQEARRTSAQILTPTASPAAIASVLDVWAENWQSPQRAADARALGRAAPGQEQKLAYATFLNRVGDPAGAVSLIGSTASLPVTADNIQLNAVLAEAFARAGRTAAAGTLLDAVLAYDSGNATALRSRAELRLQSGRAKDAVPDAEKLVSVLPKSARDRLLLARCYSSAGNQALAKRTLWDGFHAIPGSDAMFAALSSRMQGNAQALASLTEEYVQQRNAELYKGFL